MPTMTGATEAPDQLDPADERGFTTFLERYEAGLPIERAAITFNQDPPSTLVTKGGSRSQQ